MELRRRLIAVATLLTVAWTALWPLVTAAHSLLVEDKIQLCHQAGTQVAPDAMPQSGNEPASEGKMHCPLCVMAFYAAHASKLEAPPFRFSVAIVAPATRSTPFVVHFVSTLPPSRAPPLALLA